MMINRASLLIFTILVLLYLSPSPASALDCTVTNGACTGTVVFRMFSTSNSHAGTYTALTYPYAVCCTDAGHTLTAMVWSTAQESNCNPMNQGRIISLQNTINSHAENYTLSNYANNICLSSNSGNLTCDYRDTCQGGETCLASFNRDTNSHVGDCSAYTRKICCKLIDGPSVVFEEPQGDLTIRVGEQGTVMLKIINSLAVPDTFILELSGTPSKLGYWTWFNGHRYDEQKNNISITVGPGKTTNVAIVVFGGEADTNGKLFIKVRSASQGMSTELSKNVYISYGSDGMFVQTPEFGWISYVLIGLISAVLLL